MPSVVPLIPIMLDKERHLYFDHAAIMGVEAPLTQLWGREYNFYAAMRSLAHACEIGDPGALSLNNVSILLWQGCRREDPQLTLAQVQDALPCTDWLALMALVAKLMEAWNAAYPPPSALPEAEVTENGPLGGSIGNTFGPMAVSISE